jgi:hypothetical protein
MRERAAVVDVRRSGATWATRSGGRWAEPRGAASDIQARQRKSPCHLKAWGGWALTSVGKPVGAAVGSAVGVPDGCCIIEGWALMRNCAMQGHLSPCQCLTEVGAAVGSAVGSKVGAAVGTSVGAAVGESVGGAVGESVGNCTRGRKRGRNQGVRHENSMRFLALVMGLLPAWGSRSGATWVSPWGRQSGTVEIR